MAEDTRPDWLKQFHGTPASLDGVEFKIDNVTLTFGRNIKRLFIEQDDADPFATAESGDAFIKDSGKLPREFVLQCRFVGSDYIVRRDSFISLIEKGGIRQLILPNHNPIFVKAGRGVNKFSNREGGYEIVTVEFVQSATELSGPFPSATINTEKAATEGIDDSKTSFLESFATKLSTGAQWVADASSDLTALVSTTINDTLGLGAVGDALEAVTEASETLAQNATTLIYTPTVLANQINDAVSALTLAFEQPANAFNAQIQLLQNYGIISTAVGATKAEQDAIDNNNAFVQMVNNAAITEAGRAAVLTDYDSLDDALLAKKRFEEAARLQQLNNGNVAGYDESYRELANVIALVSEHIIAQGDLPSNVDISYPDTNSSLVLAEDLYGDADRAPELVTRNKSRNPLFLPRDLTVLSF